MKTNSPAPASAGRTSRGLWPVLTTVLLATNLVSAGLLWRARRSEASAEPVQPVPSAEALRPSSPTVPRELAPYRALGSFVAENNHIPDLGWTKAQFDAFADGERASFEGRGLALDDDAKRLRDQINQKVQAMLAADRPDPMQEYFRTLREKEGVKQTASGLHYRITEPGSGPPPGPDDTIVISFAGRLPDGKSLPSISRARVTMRVSDLLPGLAEAVQLLNVGAKALVYLPPALAFSDANRPPEVPPGVPVAFFIELHDIQPAGGGR